MKRTTALLVAGAALATLAAAPLSAQRGGYGWPAPYKTSGLALGAQIVGNSATYEESDVVDSGGGVAVRLGYGFTDRFSLFVAAAGSSLESEGESYTLGQVDLGARLLLSTARIRPYLEGALTARGFLIEAGGMDVEGRGPAVSLGGGLEFSLGRSFGVDVGYLHSVGEYTEGRIDGGSWETLEGDERLRSTTGRLGVGVVWRP